MLSPSRLVFKRAVSSIPRRDLTVVLIDGNAIRITCLGKGGEVRTYTLEVPRFDSDEEGGSSAFAVWLGDQAKKLNLTNRDVCVVLGDPVVLHRYYEIPGVSKREAAVAVELKLSTEIPLRLAAIQHDYVFYPKSDLRNSGATVAVAPKSMIAKLRKGCKEAGWRLNGITSVGWAIFALLRETVADVSEGVVVVLCCEDRIHLSAMHSGRLVRTYAHPREMDDLSCEVEGALARFVAAIEEGDEDFEMQHLLWIAQEPPVEFVTSLSDLYPGVHCDALMLDDHGPLTFVGLGCQSWMDERRNEAINLASPKVPRSSRPAFVGVALMVLITIGSFAGFQLRSLLNQLAVLDIRLSDVREKIGALPASQGGQADYVGVYGAVRSRESNRVDWLSHIAVLREQLPSPKNAFLTELDLVSPAQDRPAKISARGVAKSQTEIMAMNEKLAEDDGGATLVPSSIQSSGRKDGFDYSFRLDLRLSQDNEPDRMSRSILPIRDGDVQFVP